MVNDPDYHTKKRTESPEKRACLANGGFFWMNSLFRGMGCILLPVITRSVKRYRLKCYPADTCSTISGRHASKLVLVPVLPFTHRLLNDPENGAIRW